MFINFEYFKCVFKNVISIFQRKPRNLIIVVSGGNVEAIMSSHSDMRVILRDYDKNPASTEEKESDFHNDLETCPFDLMHSEKLDM